MSQATAAVFLSYASQDAQAAHRISDALRAAGIEVWFDQSELRGGDVWDQRIRRKIGDCALFMPVISANTASRHEGYFRLEWDLADQRTHRIARDRAFIVPVCIDATLSSITDVPESFGRVQWARLPAGETPPAFVERIGSLLSSAAASPASPSGAAAAGEAGSGRAVSRRPIPPALIAVLTVIAAALGYLALDRWVLSKRIATGSPAASAADRSGVSTQSAIPERSIAVLPFVDMTEKKDQGYFSDGLTEEMIDRLGQVPDLRVPARTSSFYFKGRSEDIATIARKLHVAHVLEGSVRKAGKRLRVTAQLVRADNGYQLWSHAYDRDDTDVFAVQDDIAKAVVTALKATLSTGGPETGARGTTNAEAYYHYLMGRHLDRRASLEGFRQAVEAYRQAIALDPNYAAAYAGLAVAEASAADLTGDGHGVERASRDVDKALSLAPEDAVGYAARSYLRTVWQWDWPGAQADIEKALTLDPRSSDALRQYARLLAVLGRLPEAIAAQKRAAQLDPLSSAAWESLGFYYTGIGDFAAADASIARAIDIEPTSVLAHSDLGTVRLLQGRAQEALDAFRAIDLEAIRLMGVAMAEHTLGHAAESQQALEELLAKHAHEAAYQIAQALAWRGDRDRAFEWLDRAYRQRDGGLTEIETAPLLRSLHADPRFNALLRRVKLPELPAGQITRAADGSRAPAA